MAQISSGLNTSLTCNKAVHAPFNASGRRLPARRRSLQVTAATQDKPDEKAKKQGPVSGEYKERLRDEYVGFGGAPNKPMGSNYFLWIIVIISALALAAFLTGSV